ncbi:MAG: efflux RND transporter periplasmic adaptor subunit [Gammaproteobacteria bacterium]|nr:MAG: efflux RND transporter periplasmic adaptor subunit [Gammaproteobacteria bacterium]
MMRFKTNQSMQRKLVVAILLLGVVITSLLFMFRPRADKQLATVKLPVVETITVSYQAIRIPVHSQGNVSAKIRINLSAEVAGRVIEVSPALRDGETFQRGEVLLRIDDSDYRLAMTRAEAQVAAAQQTLAKTEAEAEQARFDLQRIGRSEKETSDYALRLPHLKEARARLKAAQADLAIAELQYQRTKVIAPFNGRVITKKVDVGQYIAPGQMIADIYASDIMEVRLPLTKSQLALIDLSGLSDQQDKTNVLLSAELAGKKFSWQGRITRTESMIDSRNQLLNAVVEIDMANQAADMNASLLAPGLFVRAIISGKPLTDIIVLPRVALRYSDEVWLLQQDNILRKQTVHVLHKDDANVYVDKGVADNASIIVSALDLAVDGMKVSLINNADISVEAMQ